ncbi:MAG: UDP-glucose 4-epimerase GalE [Bacteroidales bacterium]|nr:UDP-glucose 4-epimerase GalE [Bacteroidales bacterium]
MKILITGGCGFIGSHTCVELQSAGFDVVIADNLSNSNEGVVDRIEKITGKRPEFIEADLSDAGQCSRVFEKFSNITGIINFAASKAVGESMEKPIMYYKNNLGILLNVLECMQRYGIKYFVQSSSCTVYGEPDRLPIKESSPVKDATSPYGHTKQIAEQMLGFITSSSDICAIALRYFNPIGAHPTALIGELPNGVPNNLLPFITQTAAGIRKQLKVFGNDYPTPDGTCIRDYIHVVDLAKAHVVAMNRMIGKKNKKKLEFFNIGTGHGYSVLEIINSFERSTGVKLNWEFAPRRAGDIMQIWADTEFAEKELGWKAMEDIDSMTSSAWKWQQELDKIKD